MSTRLQIAQILQWPREQIEPLINAHSIQIAHSPLPGTRAGLA